MVANPYTIDSYCKKIIGFIHQILHLPIEASIVFHFLRLSIYFSSMCSNINLESFLFCSSLYNQRLFNNSYRRTNHNGIRRNIFVYDISCSNNYSSLIVILDNIIAPAPINTLFPIFTCPILLYPVHILVLTSCANIRAAKIVTSSPI